MLEPPAVAVHAIRYMLQGQACAAQSRHMQTMAARCMHVQVSTAHVPINPEVQLAFEIHLRL